MFEVGNHLRHGGLRNSQFGRSLCHASALHDHREHVKVSQSKASANPTLPTHFLLGHRLNPIGVEQNVEFPYTETLLRLQTKAPSHDCVSKPVRRGICPCRTK